MRRNLIFIAILAFLFLLSGLSWAQDPNGPDSAYIDCTAQDVFVGANSVVSFDLKLITDNTGADDITGLAEALLITNTNAAAAPVLDTTIATTYNGGAFPGPSTNSWDIRTTQVPSNGGDPSMFPLVYVLGQVEFLEAGLLAGTYTIARIQLSVDDTTTICIDTTSTQTVQGITLAYTDANDVVRSYLARWAVGGYCCPVTPYVNLGGPACTAPAGKSGLSGSFITFAVSADDPDVIACDEIVSCNVFTIPTSINAPVFNPPCGGGNTYSGNVEWQTDPSESGQYLVVTSYTDDCQATVSCTTVVDLVSKCLFANIGEAIGRPGSKVTVPITLDASGTSVGGFTFCIEYDPVLLTFVSLERGLFFDEPGPFAGSYKWHYLVWRNNPSTVIHKFKLCVVGIGKLYYYEGKHLPQGSSGELLLTFRLSNNELYRCFRSPIIWERLDPECIVNAFSDSSGNVVNVFDDTLFFNPNLCPGQFPKADVRACARAVDGGIVFRCDEDPLVRGDINVNGFAYEIGDAVLFANYFISGIGVFSSDPDIRARQINATDINADGLVLSVADLVYLLRILTGDQAPLGGAKLAPIASAVEVFHVGEKVSSKSSVDLGAAWFVFKGEATKVEPMITGIDGSRMVYSDIVNGETRVLVYGLGKEDKGDKISSGTSELFKIYGEVKLTRVEAAGYYGAPVDVEISAGIPRPTAFTLSQNYPNPFNASTTIKFALPVDGKVSLKIYNVAGQLVKEYQQQMNAGYRSITWDGTNASGKVVASGVYFYKLQAADFTKTLKMTLLK